MRLLFTMKLSPKYDKDADLKKLIGAFSPRDTEHHG